jgi:hypothetical protein
MSDLVTRLRHNANFGIPDFTNSKLLDEAADRIAHLEMALVELSRTDGSPSNFNSASVLAAHVRVAARRSLKEARS